nr:MAG TPA: hypothetical protein [Herelleviridae sp.]
MGRHLSGTTLAPNWSLLTVIWPSLHHHDYSWSTLRHQRAMKRTATRCDSPGCSYASHPKKKDKKGGE